MSLYVAAFGFGLVIAAVIAIAAVGFTMQFAVTNMLNLAYGQVMITSAFVAYAVNSAGVNIWICLLVAAVSGSILSVLLNRFLYAPFQRKGIPLVGMVIVSVAVSLVLSNILLAIAGPDNVSYLQSSGPTYSLGSFQLTAAEIGIIAISIVLMIGIHVILVYTRLGRAMRATAANASLARNSGVPTVRIVDIVWLITGGLCGVAGAVTSMNSGSFTVADGSSLIITVLAAAVVGGAGQPYGAMLGALIIGEVTSLSAAAISPEYEQVAAFGLLIAVLIFRPRGILARVGVGSSPK